MEMSEQCQRCGGGVVDSAGQAMGSAAESQSRTFRLLTQLWRETSGARNMNPSRAETELISTPLSLNSPLSPSHPHSPSPFKVAGISNHHSCGYSVDAGASVMPEVTALSR